MRGTVVPVHRLIDPSETVRRDAERRLGVKTQAAIERGIKRTARAGSPPVGDHPEHSLYWFRANVGASGDAAYLGRVGVPSSDSAWAMANQPLVLPAAGRIVGGYLWSSDTVTTGKCQLRARLIDPNRTTDIDIPGVALTLQFPTSVSYRMPWGKCAGYAFQANTTIEGRFVTSSSFAPTTIDVGAIILVAFD